MAKFLVPLLGVIVVLLMVSCTTKPPLPAAYEDYPVYTGTDLGLTYSSERSVFKVWSPPAESLILRLYAEGSGGTALSEHPMKSGKDGVWELSLDGDHAGKFYTFQATVAGKSLAEVPDPYAKAVGVNGHRAMVVDLSLTNPEDWSQDQSPPLAAPNDVILYELHIRDLSVDEHSGIQAKGKFLGLTETGTKNAEGHTTGLDHIRELGITHVHLLPAFDFRSVDESKPEENNFNWGYDPQNYNAPEGSYSTNPADGALRIREFKQMVKTLHDQGIRVVMDVVYNHTGATEESLFNQLVPGYYYRQDENGGFSDAASCGNEIASERPMVRKFIVESVKYWVEAYHIDGFRFDLMGIHDVATMNEISRTLRAIRPDIFLYGEGWYAKSPAIPDSLLAIKRNVPQLEQIAAFSDEIRDGMRGHIFTPDEKGFLNGAPGLKENIKYGVLGATAHPQLDASQVKWLNAESPWAKDPSQCIVYASCHDNHTLWDRLLENSKESSEAEKIHMHKLAQTIVLTAQGVPFLHAGTEFLRTKYGVENSYQSPDSINKLDWSRKSEYLSVFEYYKGLIALRKAHPAFRMPTADMLATHLEFFADTPETLLAYQLRNNANGDTWKNIIVVYNGAPEPASITLPEGSWQLAADGNTVNTSGISGRTDLRGSLEVPGQTGMILFQL